jgi:hypothetical protein
MGDVIFQLFPEARDEFVGIANSHHLGAAEHGKAAKLIENVGEISGFSLSLDALCIGRQLRDDLMQSFLLKQRVGTDKCL